MATSQSNSFMMELAMRKIKESIRLLFIVSHKTLKCQIR